MDGDDTGVATDVAELVVMWAGEDFATEAAHKTDSRLQSRGGAVFMEEMVVVGAWSGGDGVGEAGVRVVDWKV